MGQAQIVDLAKQLMVLISPLVAQGALEKLGENTADATQRMLGRAWDLLRRRFAGDEDAEEALRYYQRRPDDAARQQIVADQIVARCGGDSAALAELAELVSQLRAGAAPSAGRSHRIDIGGSAQVGVAIAGDQHGGITVGAQDLSRDRRTIVAGPGVQPVHAPLEDIRPRGRIDDTTLSADGTHFTYGHALLVGVGAYREAWMSAPTTANDARALAEILRDPRIAAYPEQQVHVLADADATRAGILTALDALLQQVIATPGATALIFFAGHGARHGDSYYLLPHDYIPGDVAGSAIAGAEFHAKVSAIRAHARRLVVLLNCCHAGGVGDTVLSDGGSEEAGDPPPVGFYQPLAVGAGQVVISSSRPWQKSGAASQMKPGHTVFGAHLLDALRGQAPGDAAGIGVFELFGYLSAHVPADAQKITYKDQPLAQEPLLYAHQLDQNISVALRPNWQGGTLGHDLAQTIRQLAEVEVALAGYAHESAAPAPLLRQRAALLASLDS